LTVKLERKIFADAMLSEIKSYVAREVGGLASASRVAELIERIARLEARIAELEGARGSKQVRLAR
jgi:hypothetical protein